MTGENLNTSNKDEPEGAQSLQQPTTRGAIPRSAAPDPPSIVVATKEDFHDLIAKSVLGTMSTTFLPWRFYPQLWNSITRVFSAASHTSLKDFRQMPPEEKELFMVRLYTGADFHIPRYTSDEARQLFEFEGGYLPKSGEVFFLHPFRAKTYMIPCSANIRLAREKVFIFSDLVGCLGAKKVTLRSAVVRTRKWNGRAALPLSDAAAQVGINAKLDSESSDLAQLYLEFDKPYRRPSVPQHLELWVKADPMFASMMNGRLNSRLRKQNVTLELRERSQYSAKVVGKYARIGFEVGGSYESMVHSVWHYEIEYWPIEVST